MRRSLLLLLLALCLLPAGSAAAAERRVPQGWLGVVADGPMIPVTPAREAEWDRMAANGVESVRAAFYWPSAQPAEGAPPDLTVYDALVLAAAKRRIPVLPIVTGTPGWAGRTRGDETAPPRDPATYKALLSTLIGRYGPQGSLWAEHPEVAPLPIRAWQVWNEPNLTRYWSKQPFARSYVKLRKAAHAAVKAADPGAKVILAGLPNESWIALREVYKAGGRRYFDAVALHPYTGKPRNVVKLVELARKEMRHFKDGRKPVWITELSWPAAKGKTKNTTGFETTDKGQAKRLKEGVKRLAAARKRLRIQKVFWYTWLSREGSPNSFDYSGLRRIRGDAEISSPALRAFRAAARRLQGCAKAPGDASRCG
jgi:hypothetical protein